MLRLRPLVEPLVKSCSASLSVVALGSTNLLGKVNERRLSSDAASKTKSPPNRRDKMALFLDPRVQKFLTMITGWDESKIFAGKTVSGYKPPKYLFLSDKELEITRQRAQIEAKISLQMPPVMEPWEEKDHILADEPEFKDFDICNLVITDISPGFSDRTRLIAVREPNGVLRRARWEERYRMNQIYFPVPGRSVDVPKMFEPEHLQEVLNRRDYLFVLNRACIQFEPDDPRFIDIVHKTYEHINENKKFDILRSTRHFGPMAFYLAYEGKIDLLLEDMIKRELIEDAARLIYIYYILNPSESRQPVDFESTDHVGTIKNYLKTECKQKHPVHTSLKVYEEIMAARQEPLESMSSHG